MLLVGSTGSVGRSDPARVPYRAAMAGGVLGRLRRSVAGSIRRRGAVGPRGAAGDGDGTGAPAPSGPEIRPPDGRRWPTGGDGVTVRYAPDIDGDADPGEVVWAWVPYEEDPTQGKDRPLLAIGHQDHLVVAVPLSSRSHHDRDDAADWVEVGRGAWDSKGRVSYADTSRLLRFIPSEIRREGAALHEDAFARVVAAVAARHGWHDEASDRR